MKIIITREEALACLIALDKEKPYHWQRLVRNKLEKALGLKH